jgi:hypothetical protein
MVSGCLAGGGALLLAIALATWLAAPKADAGPTPPAGGDGPRQPITLQPNPTLEQIREALNGAAKGQTVEVTYNEKNPQGNAIQGAAADFVIPDGKNLIVSFSGGASDSAAIGAFLAAGATVVATAPSGAQTDVTLNKMPKVLDISKLSGGFNMVLGGGVTSLTEDTTIVVDAKADANAVGHSLAKAHPAAGLRLIDIEGDYTLPVGFVGNNAKKPRVITLSGKKNDGGEAALVTLPSGAEPACYLCGDRSVKLKVSPSAMKSAPVAKDSTADIAIDCSTSGDAANVDLDSFAEAFGNTRTAVGSVSILGDNVGGLTAATQDGVGVLKVLAARRAAWENIKQINFGESNAAGVPVEFYVADAKASESKTIRLSAFAALKEAVLPKNGAASANVLANLSASVTGISFQEASEVPTKLVVPQGVTNIKGLSGQTSLSKVTEIDLSACDGKVAFEGLSTDPASLNVSGKFSGLTKLTVGRPNVEFASGLAKDSSVKEVIVAAKGFSGESGKKIPVAALATAVGAGTLRLPDVGGEVFDTAGITSNDWFNGKKIFVLNGKEYKQVATLEDLSKKKQVTLTPSSVTAEGAMGISQGRGFLLSGDPSSVKKYTEPPRELYCTGAATSLPPFCRGLALHVVPSGATGDAEEIMKLSPRAAQFGSDGACPMLDASKFPGLIKLDPRRAAVLSLLDDDAPDCAVGVVSLPSENKVRSLDLSGGVTVRGVQGPSGFGKRVETITLSSGKPPFQVLGEGAELSVASGPGAFDATSFSALREFNANGAAATALTLLNGQLALLEVMDLRVDGAGHCDVLAKSGPTGTPVSVGTDFSQFTKLGKLTFGGGGVTLGAGPAGFKAAPALKHITLAKGTQIAGGDFANCPNVKELWMHASVARQITKGNIPPGIESIHVYSDDNPAGVAVLKDGKFCINEGLFGDDVSLGFSDNKSITAVSVGAAIKTLDTLGSSVTTIEFTDTKAAQSLEALKTEGVKNVSIDGASCCAGGVLTLPAESFGKLRELVFRHGVGAPATIKVLSTELAKVDVASKTGTAVTVELAAEAKSKLEVFRVGEGVEQVKLGGSSLFAGDGEGRAATFDGGFGVLKDLAVTDPSIKKLGVPSTVTSLTVGGGLATVCGPDDSSSGPVAITTSDGKKTATIARDFDQFSIVGDGFHVVDIGGRKPPAEFRADSINELKVGTGKFDGCTSFDVSLAAKDFHVVDKDGKAVADFSDFFGTGGSGARVVTGENTPLELFAAGNVAVFDVTKPPAGGKRIPVLGVSPQLKELRFPRSVTTREGVGLAIAGIKAGGGASLESIRVFYGEGGTCALSDLKITTAAEFDLDKTGGAADASGATSVVIVGDPAKQLKSLALSSEVTSLNCRGASGGDAAPFVTGDPGKRALKAAAVPLLEDIKFGGCTIIDEFESPDGIQRIAVGGALKSLTLPSAAPGHIRILDLSDRNPELKVGGSIFDGKNPLNFSGKFNTAGNAPADGTPLKDAKALLVVDAKDTGCVSRAGLDDVLTQVRLSPKSDAGPSADKPVDTISGFASGKFVFTESELSASGGIKLEFPAGTTGVDPGALRAWVVDADGVLKMKSVYELGCPVEIVIPAGGLADGAAIVPPAQMAEGVTAKVTILNPKDAAKVKSIGQCDKFCVGVAGSSPAPSTEGVVDLSVFTGLESVSCGNLNIKKLVLADACVPNVVSVDLGSSADDVMVVRAGSASAKCGLGEFVALQDLTCSASSFSARPGKFAPALKTLKIFGDGDLDLSDLPNGVKVTLPEARLGGVKKLSLGVEVWTDGAGAAVTDFSKFSGLTHIIGSRGQYSTAEGGRFASLPKSVTFVVSDGPLDGTLLDASRLLGRVCGGGFADAKLIVVRPDPSGAGFGDIKSWNATALPLGSIGCGTSPDNTKPLADAALLTGLECIAVDPKQAFGDTAGDVFAKGSNPLSAVKFITLADNPLDPVAAAAGALHDIDFTKARSPFADLIKRDDVKIRIAQSLAGKLKIINATTELAAKVVIVSDDDLATPVADDVSTRIMAVMVPGTAAETTAENVYSLSGTNTKIAVGSGKAVLAGDKSHLASITFDQATTSLAHRAADATDGGTSLVSGGAFSSGEFTGLRTINYNGCPLFTAATLGGPIEDFTLGSGVASLTVADAGVASVKRLDLSGRAAELKVNGGDFSTATDGSLDLSGGFTGDVGALQLNHDNWQEGVQLITVDIDDYRKIKLGNKSDKVYVCPRIPTGSLGSARICGVAIDRLVLARDNIRALADGGHALTIELPGVPQFADLSALKFNVIEADGKVQQVGPGELGCSVNFVVPKGGLGPNAKLLLPEKPSGSATTVSVAIDAADVAQVETLDLSNGLVVNVGSASIIATGGIVDLKGFTGLKVLDFGDNDVASATLESSAIAALTAFGVGSHRGNVVLKNEGDTDAALGNFAAAKSLRCNPKFFEERVNDLPPNLESLTIRGAAAADVAIDLSGLPPSVRRANLSSDLLGCVTAYSLAVELGSLGEGATATVVTDLAALTALKKVTGTAEQYTASPLLSSVPAAPSAPGSPPVALPAIRQGITYEVSGQINGAALAGGKFLGRVFVEGVGPAGKLILREADATAAGLDKVEVWDARRLPLSRISVGASDPAPALTNADSCFTGLKHLIVDVLAATLNTPLFADATSVSKVLEKVVIVCDPVPAADTEVDLARVLGAPVESLTSGKPGSILVEKKTAACIRLKISASARREILGIVDDDLETKVTDVNAVATMAPVKLQAKAVNVSDADAEADGADAETVTLVGTDAAAKLKALTLGEGTISAGYKATAADATSTNFFESGILDLSALTGLEILKFPGSKTVKSVTAIPASVQTFVAGPALESFAPNSTSGLARVDISARTVEGLKVGDGSATPIDSSSNKLKLSSLFAATAAATPSTAPTTFDDAQYLLTVRAEDLQFIDTDNRPDGVFVRPMILSQPTGDVRIAGVPHNRVVLRREDIARVKTGGHALVVELAKIPPVTDLNGGVMILVAGDDGRITPTKLCDVGCNVVVVAPDGAFDTNACLSVSPPSAGTPAGGTVTVQISESDRAKVGTLDLRNGLNVKVGDDPVLAATPGVDLDLTAFTSLTAVNVGDRDVGGFLFATGSESKITSFGIGSHRGSAVTIKVGGTDTTIDGFTGLASLECGAATFATTVGVTRLDAVGELRLFGDDLPDATAIDLTNLKSGVKVALSEAHLASIKKLRLGASLMQPDGATSADLSKLTGLEQVIGTADQYGGASFANLPTSGRTVLMVEDALTPTAAAPGTLLGRVLSGERKAQQLAFTQDAGSAGLEHITDLNLSELPLDKITCNSVSPTDFSSFSGLKHLAIAAPSGGGTTPVFATAPGSKLDFVTIVALKGVTVGTDRIEVDLNKLICNPFTNAVTKIRIPAGLAEKIYIPGGIVGQETEMFEIVDDNNLTTRAADQARLQGVFMPKFHDVDFGDGAIGACLDGIPSGVTAVKLSGTWGSNAKTVTAALNAVKSLDISRVDGLTSGDNTLSVASGPGGGLLAAFPEITDITVSGAQLAGLGTLLDSLTNLKTIRVIGAVAPGDNVVLPQSVTCVSINTSDAFSGVTKFSFLNHNVQLFDEKGHCVVPISALLDDGRGFFGCRRDGVTEFSYGGGLSDIAKDGKVNFSALPALQVLKFSGAASAIYSGAVSVPSTVTSVKEIKNDSDNPCFCVTSGGALQLGDCAMTEFELIGRGNIKEIETKDSTSAGGLTSLRCQFKSLKLHEEVAKNLKELDIFGLGGVQVFDIGGSAFASITDAGSKFVALVKEKTKVVHCIPEASSSVTTFASDAFGKHFTYRCTDGSNRTAFVADGLAALDEVKFDGNFGGLPADVVAIAEDGTVSATLYNKTGNVLDITCLVSATKISVAADGVTRVSISPTAAAGPVVYKLVEVDFGDKVSEFSISDKAAHGDMTVTVQGDVLKKFEDHAKRVSSASEGGYTVTIAGGGNCALEELLLDGADAQKVSLPSDGATLKRVVCNLTSIEVQKGGSSVSLFSHGALSGATSLKVLLTESDLELDGSHQTFEPLTCLEVMSCGDIKSAPAKIDFDKCAALRLLSAASTPASTKEISASSTKLEVARIANVNNSDGVWFALPRTVKVLEFKSSSNGSDLDLSSLSSLEAVVLSGGDNFNKGVVLPGSVAAARIAGDKISSVAIPSNSAEPHPLVDVSGVNVSATYVISGAADAQVYAGDNPDTVDTDASKRKTVLDAAVASGGSVTYVAKENVDAAVKTRFDEVLKDVLNAPVAPLATSSAP